MWRLIRAAGTALLLVLAGCTTTGGRLLETRSIDEIRSSITVGATHKTELDAALAGAEVIKFDSGYEVWVYKDYANVRKLAGQLPGDRRHDRLSARPCARTDRAVRSGGGVRNIGWPRPEVRARHQRVKDHHPCACAIGGRWWRGRRTQALIRRCSSLARA